MNTEQQTPPPPPPFSTPTTFKSAFGHSLRSSAPVPVPRHLAHFTTAVLCGRYTLKVTNGPNNNLSLELALPEYDSEGFEEGLLVFDEEIKGLRENGPEMLQEILATTIPCRMIEQSARGALKTMFEFVSQSYDSVNSVAELKTVKVASVEIVRDALKRLQEESESVAGRTIKELDALLASAEMHILNKLLEVTNDNQPLLTEYLNKVIQLHKDLEADTSIDSDPPIEDDCCAAGGGCCGGHTCHDDGDDCGGCDADDCCADDCGAGDCGADDCCKTREGCCDHNH